MRKPQEILQEYLDGINQVIESGPPKKERAEIERIRLMFLSGIQIMNNYIANCKNAKSLAHINSSFDAQDEKLAFHIAMNTVNQEKIIKLRVQVSNLTRSVAKKNIKLDELLGLPKFSYLTKNSNE